MRQTKFTAIMVLSVIAAFGTARATAQAQQQDTQRSSEYAAYQVAHDETDSHIKIALLDDFVTKYPDSPLLAEAYRDYYAAYFDLPDYPRVIDSADKLVALGDAVSVDSRILALVSREVAYSAGCSDARLRTPDAYLEARDAGRLGLQLMGQWPKPENMNDEQFAADKKSFAIIFHGVTEMADSGLAGQTVVCTSPSSSARTTTPPFDGRKIFDHLIDSLKEQERQSPRVR